VTQKNALEMDIYHLHYINYYSFSGYQSVTI